MSCVKLVRCNILSMSEGKLVWCHVGTPFRELVSHKNNFNAFVRKQGEHLLLQLFVATEMVMVLVLRKG